MASTDDPLIAQQTASPDRYAMLRLADKYYEIGENYLAARECLRFLFFFPDDSLSFYANYRAGLADLRVGQTRRGLQSLRSSLSLSRDPGTTERMRYRLGVELARVREYQLAKLELYPLASFGQVSELRSAAPLLLVTIAIIEHDWEAARQWLVTFSQRIESTSEIESRIQNLSVELTSAASVRGGKSVDVAKWLSTFVPGGGLVYAGKPLFGTFALAANSWTTYQISKAVLDRSVVDAFLLVTNLWWRYYQGNRLHSEEAVINKRERVGEQIVSSLLIAVQRLATESHVGSVEIFSEQLDPK